jgi:hypothetical protein
MHIGLCIVSTKFTSKLKFWILRTGNKRMTRIGITQTLPSKSVECLTMFFKCLLDLHSLTFRFGLSLISLCQHRTLRMIVHSSACFILSTTMVEIEKWTFKLTRLVGNSFQLFSSFVNSHAFIHNINLPFIVHFLIMHLFYYVLSMIEHMSTGHSFCTTSYSTGWTRLHVCPWLHLAICSWTHRTVKITLINIEYFLMIYVNIFGKHV